MTSNQAAVLLGVSRQRIQQLIIEGRLRSTKPGRDIDVDPASVDEEIARRKAIIEGERDKVTA